MRSFDPRRNCSATGDNSNRDLSRTIQPSGGARCAIAACGSSRARYLRGALRGDPSPLHRADFRISGYGLDRERDSVRLLANRGAFDGCTRGTADRIRLRDPFRSHRRAGASRGATSIPWSTEGIVTGRSVPLPGRAVGAARNPGVILTECRRRLGGMRC